MERSNITKQQAINSITKAFIAKEIITIDPGKSNGGIAKWTGERVETWPIKKISDFEALVDFMKYQKEICKLPLVFLEKINSFAGDYNDPAAKGKIFRMNKLKDHYVELRSAIKLAKFDFIEVMPYHWEKYINIHEKGEEYKIRKKRYRDIAKDWFPTVNVTAWNADALLLIEFAKKKLKYDNRWILKNTQKSEKKLI